MPGWSTSTSVRLSSVHQSSRPHHGYGPDAFTAITLRISAAGVPQQILALTTAPRPRLAGSIGAYFSQGLTCSGFGGGARA